MSPQDRAHILARTGNASALIKLCRDHPGLINTRSPESGGTLLHTAARYGNARTAYHMLTKLGANPQLQDKTGQRPIDLAAKSGHGPTTKLLEEATHPKIQLEIMRIERENGDANIEPPSLKEAELRQLTSFVVRSSASRRPESHQTR